MTRQELHLYVDAAVDYAVTDYIDATTQTPNAALHDSVDLLVQAFVEHVEHERQRRAGRVRELHAKQVYTGAPSLQLLR